MKRLFYLFMMIAALSLPATLMQMEMTPFL